MPPRGMSCVAGWDRYVSNMRARLVSIDDDVPISGGVSRPE